MASLRILWLKTGPLHPLDTGGKIRTYNMLRELKKHHELTYLALCPPSCAREHLKAASEYSHQQIWVSWEETKKGSTAFFNELAGNFLGSRLPYVIAKYRSEQMARKIQEIDSSGACDLIICDFLTPSVNLFLHGYRPKTPTLLFQHNVESLIWKRLFDKASGAVKKFYFRRQWQRMEQYEKDACSACDGVVAVSDEDAALFREFGIQNVLGAVPTGVDVPYFASIKPNRKPQSMVFLGSMDWMPNIDAAHYFANEVFPLIKAKFPKVTWTIVGRNPPQSVKDLGAADPQIIVTGTVADVRPYLAEADIMIVPLRIGGGTRIKIYEGMASATPVVSTRIGAEGLPVTTGGNILLADSPEDFTQAVGDLFNNTQLREKIGNCGRAFVQERFGWEAVNQVFDSYCQQLCSKKD
jgi:glycosyltransferase involved in cell wall biosynthesis